PGLRPHQKEHGGRRRNLPVRVVEQALENQLAGLDGAPGLPGAQVRRPVVVDVELLVVLLALVLARSRTGSPPSRKGLLVQDWCGMVDAARRLRYQRIPTIVRGIN